MWCTSRLVKLFFFFFLKYLTRINTLGIAPPRVYRQELQMSEFLPEYQTKKQGTKYDAKCDNQLLLL